jgi:glyoxylase-like metal-dependent hydrolase (beta-lactamase superfamily II)
MRRKIIWFGLLWVTALSLSRAQTETPTKKKEIQITWLGHAAFELVSSGGTDILIDPFLTKNPATPAELKDLAHYHPNFILVTHSHGDHLGDAVELAKMRRLKSSAFTCRSRLKKGNCLAN